MVYNLLCCCCFFLLQSGIRDTPIHVRDEAFENGVKNGFVESCNSKFIDGQWSGHEIARKMVSLTLCKDNQTNKNENNETQNV